MTLVKTNMHFRVVPRQICRCNGCIYTVATKHSILWPVACRWSATKWTRHMWT